MESIPEFATLELITTYINKRFEAVQDLLAALQQHQHQKDTFQDHTVFTADMVTSASSSRSMQPPSSSDTTTDTQISEIHHDAASSAFSSSSSSSSSSSRSPSRLKIYFAVMTMDDMKAVAKLQSDGLQPISATLKSLFTKQTPSSLFCISSSSNPSSSLLADEPLLRSPSRMGSIETDGGGSGVGVEEDQDEVTEAKGSRVGQMGNMDDSNVGVGGGGGGPNGKQQQQKRQDRRNSMEEEEEVDDDDDNDHDGSGGKSTVTMGYAVAVFDSVTGDLSVLDMILRVPTVQQRLFEKDFMIALVRKVVQDVEDAGGEEGAVGDAVDEDGKEKNRCDNDAVKKFRRVERVWMLMERDFVKWRVQMGKVGFTEVGGGVDSTPPSSLSSVMASSSLSFVASISTPSSRSGLDPTISTTESTIGDSSGLSSTISSHAVDQTTVPAPSEAMPSSLTSLTARPPPVPKAKPTTTTTTTTRSQVVISKGSNSLEAIDNSKQERQERQQQQQQQQESKPLECPRELFALSKSRKDAVLLTATVEQVLKR
jgi:hypothetical protein